MEGVAVVDGVEVHDGMGRQEWGSAGMVREPPPERPEAMAGRPCNPGRSDRLSTRCHEHNGNAAASVAAKSPCQLLVGDLPRLVFAAPDRYDCAFLLES